MTIRKKARIAILAAQLDCQQECQQIEAKAPPLPPQPQPQPEVKAQGPQPHPSNADPEYWPRMYSILKQQWDVHAKSCRHYAPSPSHPTIDPKVLAPLLTEAEATNLLRALALLKQ